jgi:hypothetical protein
MPTRRSGPGRSRSARSSSAQASSPILAAAFEVAGELFGHPTQLVVQALRVADVPGEGLLGRDRDPLGRHLERPRVDPSGAVAELEPDLAAQNRGELVVGEGRERSDRRHAGREQTLLGPRPDARQDADRERREKRRLATGADGRQAARLAPVRRDLRHALRARDAQGAGQAGTGADDRLHSLGNRARICERAGDLAEVEVPLVDPRLLDGRDDLTHDRPDIARVLAVHGHARPQECRVRTAPERLGAGHRRPDPEAPRRVVGGRDDAAAVRVAADDERNPPEGGVLELLDRSEERVEVEVRDDHETSLDSAPDAAATGESRFA